MSLNDSTGDTSAGALAGVDSGVLGLDAFGSDVLGLDVSGFDMKRLKPLAARYRLG